MSTMYGGQKKPKKTKTKLNTIRTQNHKSNQWQY